MTRAGVDLRVVAVTDAAPDVRSLEFAAAPGTGSLPAAPPGGHIGIEWAPGRWNSYSLTAPSPAPDRWHVSVARRPDSRGGSVWAHGLVPGDAVVATTPRSSFPPVDTARHHLLVAGGIGVTAVLSHARWHAFWGNPYTVLTVHRPGPAPHRDALRALCGDRLVEATGRAEARAALERLLGTAPFGSHVYTCGPPGLIAATARTARAAHWVDARIHAEAFVGEPERGTPFRAVLRSSGRTVEVGAHETLLDAVHRAGVTAPRCVGAGSVGSA
ncbi:ferredoxin reductase [Pseudonocardia sp. HH130629-09]|uniref:ferredoxin reductase n=1 Tax=Pseudonocardia sp. HH130629-09 TaxID=1641402 RepID=UPI0007616CB6|nr:ferredoxin reductase [Pseudonocardia sp. HH130629-09]